MSLARNRIDSQKLLSQSLKFQLLSSEMSLVLGSQRPESNHEGLLVVVQSLSCVLLFATPWTAAF